MAVRLSVLVCFWMCCLRVDGKHDLCYLSRHLDSKKGFALEGYNFEIVGNASLVRCASLCFLQNHHRCRSFNFYLKTHLCELNTHNSRDVPKALGSIDGVRFYQSAWFLPRFFDGYEPSHCLASGPCGNSISFYNLRCYEIREDRRTHAQAVAQCSKKFGRLAAFPISDEKTLITNALVSAGLSDHYYIGMDDLDEDGKWTWIDGSGVFMTQPPWKPLQPDSSYTPEYGKELCGAIERDTDNDFLYNDVPCTLEWSFICEYDPWVYQNW